MVEPCPLLDYVALLQGRVGLVLLMLRVLHSPFHLFERVQFVPRWIHSSLFPDLVWISRYNRLDKTAVFPRVVVCSRLRWRNEDMDAGAFLLAFQLLRGMLLTLQLDQR